MAHVRTNKHHLLNNTSSTKNVKYMVSVNPYNSKELILLACSFSDGTKAQKRIHLVQALPLN